MKRLLLPFCFIWAVAHINGQSITSENITLEVVKIPQTIIDSELRNYKVTVSSPYNLTAEDVLNQSILDHEDALIDYDNLVFDSEIRYQEKLKEFEAETERAKEKYEIESEAFKKLSLIERMALIDQKKDPKLILPARPIYYKPKPPVYREPNLNNFIIVDNNVLASRIEIFGFKRGTPNLDINIDIQKTNFQDNAGQTYVNQPTKLIVKLNGAEVINHTFFQEYEFISSSSSNNIDKVREEKKYLEKIVVFLNNYLNDMYGYPVKEKTIKLQSVKNSKNLYDDLERARIFVTTNLKKLQGDVNSKANEAAYTNMQKGIDIWVQTLEKIDYKDDKATFNAKIGKFIFFNLIKLNLALNKKDEAEKFLNQMQDNLVYIKLSSDETKELKQLEQEIYKN